MITLQELILRLLKFWENQGCIIHQGHDLETGAGTFNPATFLRCLGPEPYKTAYVEPSRRPSDGRFGQNPNRLQLFHQFQVILKPSPFHVQNLYLQSLEAIGLDLEDHDIRFVHDDWESPTLGAWGLGWEVWCDGMEVSQFTYFQGMASLPLNPITAEITYGIERLCMFIQNVDNIFDVKWNEELTLKDICQQSEIQWSEYNFSKASTSMWLRHFEDYEKEAGLLVQANLPIPAYDFVIKASHAFNLLDARGVISVTERTGYISRIRELARSVATQYIAKRQEAGFPLVKSSSVSSPSSALSLTPPSHLNETGNFLLEIGSEQLPASFITKGMKSLEQILRLFLKKEEIAFEKLHLYGTPRRIAIYIENLPSMTKSCKLKKKGPPLTIAFDADGNITLQGEKFLASMKMPPLSLTDIIERKIDFIWIEEIKGVRYLFGEETIEGKSTFSLLEHHLPLLIAEIEFPKKMKWADLDVTYARPIHWICALLDHTIIPFSYGNITSSNITYGHAQMANHQVLLPAAHSYKDTLKQHFVLADVDERKESILKQIVAFEETHHFQLQDVDKVLHQVVHLTEWPQLTLGTFDPAFLTLPAEVIASEMIEHQKYFPICKNNHLTNQFMITCDNTPSDLIRQGNEKVLSARLADGTFLYQQDLSTSLEAMNAKLSQVIFQKDLGSMQDKVRRITLIAETINGMTHLANASTLQRAAFLAKADLASSLVKEFPELQGTLGRYYALHQNEAPQVAAAIAEHWLPRFEADTLPQSPSGIILALADKLDNLVGYYCAGLKPSSSSDPYALRRQTIGILRILIHSHLSLDLQSVIHQIFDLYPVVTEEVKKEIFRFILARAQTVFEDLDFKKDEVEAVLSRPSYNPYVLYCQLKALRQFRSSPIFNDLLEVYKRAKGVLSTKIETALTSQLMEHPAEKQLLHALESIASRWDDLYQNHQYEEIYTLLATLQKPLSMLFAEVKILDPNPAIQQNRLALIQSIFSYFAKVIDFSKIQLL